MTTNDVVDAQGGSHNSGRRSHNSVKVAKGGGLLEVKTTQAKRDKAANKALSYVGRPYNYDFAFNKREGSKMNCSQLVWAAYNYGAGIDLSSGWAAPAVYPWDIKNSGWTSFYRQY